jgi:hypothetical protein
MKMTMRLCSLLLILLLLGAMTLPLYAAESNVTATVIATNSPTYTVVVPSEILADDLQRTPETSYYKEDFTIRVSEVTFLDNKKIELF